MRATADTNIWLRGLFRAGSHPGRVVTAWYERRFTLVTSEPLLSELLDVLTRPEIRAKFGFTPEIATALVADMRGFGEIVSVTGNLHLCRDPKDDVFLETALVGGADVLVSQDNDLLSLTVPGLCIMSAYDFAERLAGQP